ncbi:MAG: HAMP domain-containing histidine kinase, partial [Planctomycetaceae bacterium]|nr:HAMP domain-containing histidine kinase [Planctomycetaceae bacterium]
RQANFVDSVTHELKSPIAALQLYLETLRMRNLSEEKRAEFHKVMENELQRLDRLISQLLEVGRLDAIGENEEPRDVRIDSLIRQFQENVCIQWNLPLEETFESDLPPTVVRAPKILLDLIFSNLIENAVKYAGSPPQIFVRIKEVSNNRIQIQITNNGAGVPREERKKIFQIFYRGGSELERRRKGTGLGLYIVHTLVRKLRGRVSVHDREDGKPGCTFHIDLPGFRDHSQTQTS